jgi:hypothetical protein
MSRNICGRCGKTPAAGSASINGVRYCHESPEPTCYMLTLWGVEADHGSRLVTPEDRKRAVILDLRDSTSGVRLTPGMRRNAGGLVISVDQRRRRIMCWLFGHPEVETLMPCELRICTRCNEVVR